MAEALQLLSIGALSRATGVPADTLRTWERRYGFPVPERTASGHRRYSLLTLDRLRLVTQALQLGHRPAALLTADVFALQQLLAAGSADAPSQAQSDDVEGQARVQRWLAHVEHFEGRGFERDLRATALELGGLRFMEQAVGPFLRELGAHWAEGALGVRHEHFASERLRDFLVSQWRPLSDAAGGSRLVCATPAGEAHVLGLHMAAFALALHDARIVFLGASVPAAEIAQAVQHHAASAVILSAAAGIDHSALEREVAALRAALPDGAVIMAGGAGFRSAPAQVLTARSLAGLVDWYCRDL